MSVAWKKKNYGGNEVKSTAGYKCLEIEFIYIYFKQ